MCHPVSRWQTQGSDLFIKGQVTSWSCTKTRSHGGKEPNAHSCAEKSRAWLKELGKASQLLNRVFGLAPRTLHRCGVLCFQAGWAGRDYWSEAIALNWGKGNVGMNDNKPGFKPLLLNSTDIKPGKKALLLIALVNQVVVLTLATVRTNNQFSMRYQLPFLAAVPFWLYLL